MSDGTLAEQFDDRAQQRTAAETGMWIFIASEILFFGVLFFAYSATRVHFPAAFAAASRHTDVVLGSINTALLLTSSFTMALAVRAAELGRGRSIAVFMGLTIAFGVAFAGIKFTEYRHDYLDHLVPWLDFRFDPAQRRGAELFFYLYFVMTGFHALHLAIGIAAVGTVAVLASKGAFTARYFLSSTLGS